jgi:hypothetical protein
MIEKKLLNTKIKEKGFLYFIKSSNKFYPQKIGRWSSVDVVLIKMKDRNRVIDLEYVLKNASQFNTNF